MDSLRARGYVSGEGVRRCDGRGGVPAAADGDAPGFGGERVRVMVDLSLPGFELVKS